MTHKRVGREFFAAHTVTELSAWSEFDLENQGRLTEPMSYDPETDRYVPISWADAFELAGRALRELDDPNRAAFYTSGRLGNEATLIHRPLHQHSRNIAPSARPRRGPRSNSCPGSAKSGSGRPSTSTAPPIAPSSAGVWVSRSTSTASTPCARS